MDDLDLVALRQLQNDGRATWAALGDTLGMTGPAAAERVRRLEARGVIQRYVALIDPDAAGLPLTAFVALTLERPDNQTAFLEKIAALAEVQECHHVAGADDYLLKVRCRGTLDLDRILSEELR